MWRQTRGMTVTEALVVVAVVGVLVFVLLPPVCFSCKEDARRAACKNNLKQIALGIVQYCEDHDRQMPPMDDVNRFANSIGPYINHSTRLFICPHDQWEKPAADMQSMSNSSYAWIPTVTMEVHATNFTMIMFDKLQPGGLTLLTGQTNWHPRTAHKGEGGNILYTDGHVEWRKVLDVGTNRYPVVND